MRKILILPIIVTVLPLCVSAQVRGTQFGSQIADVKSIEGEPDVDYDGTGLYLMSYNVSLANMKSLVTYVFADDTLTRIRYSFLEKHSNNNLYLDDFAKVKKILIQKYGDPDNTDTFWSNSLYKDDLEDYGTAISIGHLSLQNGWDRPDMEILHSLRGDNFDIYHVLEYQSVDFIAIEQRVKERQNLSDF